MHDTTDLIYAKFASTKGLGTLSRAPNMPTGLQGIFLHNSLILTESGTPLGIIKQSFYTYEDYRHARGQLEKNFKGNHKQYPIEAKASWRWVDHAMEVQQLCDRLEKEVIHVFDREGDIYELFQAIDINQGNYVIRSTFDRRTRCDQDAKSGTKTICRLLKKATALGTISIETKSCEGKHIEEPMVIKAVKKDRKNNGA